MYQFGAEEGRIDQEGNNERESKIDFTNFGINRANQF